MMKVRRRQIPQMKPGTFEKGMGIEATTFGIRPSTLGKRMAPWTFGKGMEHTTFGTMIVRAYKRGIDLWDGD